MKTITTMDTPTASRKACRVRMGRGNIWAHFITWAGAVRPKTANPPKTKCDGRTDQRTNGPTKRGVESRSTRLKREKEEREKKNQAEGKSWLFIWALKENYGILLPFHLKGNKVLWEWGWFSFQACTSYSLLVRNNFNNPSVSPLFFFCVSVCMFVCLYVWFSFQAVPHIVYLIGTTTTIHLLHVSP